MFASLKRLKSLFSDKSKFLTHSLILVFTELCRDAVRYAVTVSFPLFQIPACVVCSMYAWIYALYVRPFIENFSDN